jgi:uncharacterized metal-binding protein
MPNARTHDRIAITSAFVLAPATAGALILLDEPRTDVMIGTALLVGSHLVCSYWLSPDLDLDSAIDDRWGPLRPIWLPYQKIVPHRHWFSHSGISALLRLLYLAAIALLVLLLAGLLIPGALQTVTTWLGTLVQDYPLETLLVAVGAVVSDAIHTGSDYFSTYLRRRRVRRWRRRRRRR